MIEINGFHLPKKLEALLQSGRWKLPEDSEALGSLFPDAVDRSYAKFYSVELMQQESGAQSFFWMYEGVLVRAEDPGRPIDPTALVFIGDIDVDSPFALDFGNPESEPPVLYWGGAGWLEIAHDFDEFAARAGLSAPG